jgi:chromosome segregation ATPase
MTPDQIADALDQARQQFNRAREHMQRTEERAERTRAEVTRAKAVVSAHGDVEGRIAAWDADRRRLDLGSAELPDGLAQAQRRLAVSKQDVENAERTLQLLEQEAHQLRQAVNRAGAELRAFTDVVTASSEEPTLAREPGRE